MRRKVIQSQIQDVAEQASSCCSESGVADDQQNESKSVGKGQRAADKIKFLHKLLRLWVPFKRVHRIGCVTDDKGSVISDKGGVAGALAE
eukprot:10052207-Karenia_brevis.AAC.1